MGPLIKRKDILLNRFVKLVEEHHQVITESFMNDLLKNSETPAYRGVDRAVIYDASDRVYRDLSVWVSKEFPREKIRERYIKLGQERCEMGIPLHQVMKGLILQRRHLWLFVMDKLYDDSTAYQEALQVNNRVTLYFDRAIIYAAQGYMEMLSRRMIG